MKRHNLIQHKTNNSRIFRRLLFRIPVYILLACSLSLCFIASTNSAPLSDLDDAIIFEDWTDVREIVEAKPIDMRKPFDWQALGYAALADQDYPVALEAFSNLPGPDDIETIRLVEHVEDLAYSHPDSLRPKILQADALVRAGMFEKGIAVFENYFETAKPVEWNNDITIAKNLHGTINALGGNLDAARRDFNEVLSMNPDFGDALVGLANVEALEGNIPAALEGYDSALTAYPDHELASSAKRQLAAIDTSTSTKRFMDSGVGHSTPMPSQEAIEEHDKYWTKGQYWEDDPYYEGIKDLDNVAPLTPENYLKAYGLALGATASFFAEKIVGGLPGIIKAIGDELIPFNRAGKTAWEAAWLFEKGYSLWKKPAKAIVCFVAGKALRMSTDNFMQEYEKHTGCKLSFNTPTTQAITPKPNQPEYHVVSETTISAYSAGGWRIVGDEGNWVLVGREEDPLSNYVPVLVTTDSDRPDTIAKSVRKRNDEEYPGQKAIILLDGDPESERNKKIAAGLMNQEYDDSDIFYVINGDVCTKDRKCILSGDGIITDEARSDKILAHGQLGDALRSLFNRPVIGVIWTPRSFGFEYSDTSSDEQLVPVYDYDNNRKPHIYVYDIWIPRPPPPPPPIYIPHYDPGGVYTVDEENLEVVDADDAGTGFIFGDSDEDEETLTADAREMEIRFLIFPNMV